MKKFDNECKQCDYYRLLFYVALFVLVRCNKKEEKEYRKFG
jgi:hypothetical protein